uniref:glycerol-3-phosphate 1-O-acyltransferase PlsY n=1 Tax=Philodulcilactobacillus myokoensis TaxID=2929573 RepID=UPI0025711176|nr:glycerol-3-phosphate 1-O-acyltransferase PlsY [Philodulcilactobacillus myokoensis]
MIWRIKLKLIILMIAAYLLGSIPNGVWIGKAFFNIDIRQHGSENIGTTNTYRVLGTTAGTIVMILDISKGTVAALLPIIFHVSLFSDNLSKLIFGILAVIGHTFSIFDRFRGGKAVATSAGMLLAYNPYLFLLAVVSIVIMISIFSMVSLGSMFTFTLITVVSFLTGDRVLTPLALLLTIFVFYRHRQNIVRIKNGTEGLVPFGLNYWHKHQHQL